MSLPAAAIAALHEGRKIDAIKIVRRERGVELKEAKQAVDSYVRSQPALEAALDARQAVAVRTLLGWIVGAALVLVVLYVLVWRA
jgi:ribosomal protein L7/L12